MLDPRDDGGDWFRITAFIVIPATILGFIICFFLFGFHPEWTVFGFNNWLAMLITTALILAGGFGLSVILFIFVVCLPSLVESLLSKKNSSHRLSESYALKRDILIACGGIEGIPVCKPPFAKKEWSQKRHEEYLVLKKLDKTYFCEINCSLIGGSSKNAVFGLVSHKAKKGKLKVFSPFIKTNNHFGFINEEDIKAGFIEDWDDSEKIDKIIHSHRFKKDGCLHTFRKSIKSDTLYKEASTRDSKNYIRYEERE